VAAESGEKTEAPTQRRVSEARQRGQVAKSVELTAAAALLGAMLSLRMFGLRLMSVLRDMMAALLGSDGHPADTLDALAMISAQAGYAVIAAAMPIMASLAVVAIAINLMQTGPLLSWHPLTPKFSKLNPIEGVGRLFSMRSLVQLVVNLLKLTLVSWLAWHAIIGDADIILAAQEVDERQLLGIGALLSYELGMKIAAVLLFMALLDYAYHRWQHEKDLRMTKQEVKEEMKHMDGDPLLKQRRRQIQMQLAARRLAREVPRADVIVTNPTHFAVAIRYDDDRMHAPIVTAKGVDFMAQRIRELAIRHGVPIVQRKALAQALYKGVEVGQEVPPKFYKAIAEILAYVYELSGKGARRKKTAARGTPSSLGVGSR
jgi:flagellar biosynthetic protein FlhB